MTTLAAASRHSLHRHPFVARIDEQTDLTPGDLAALEGLFDGEQTVRKRHDLVVDGNEYRRLCFITDGYAVRYKLLRNGKRQVLNVILPGDVVGLPSSFYRRAVYSVTAITDLRMQVCSLDAYVRLCYAHPRFGLLLSWIAVQEATTYAEHIIDVGRRTPIERLSHFLLELHARLKAIRTRRRTRLLPAVLAGGDGGPLGPSVPHLNRMMQQLRADHLIVSRARALEFLDAPALQTLAHYQPQAITPIPPPSGGM